MKLFRKIYLLVFVGMLTLSFALLSYLLWESARQNLNAVRQYEIENFDLRARRFEERIERNQIGSTAEKMEPLIITEAFRWIFGSSAALYQNGEEIYNTTPYQFDSVALKKQHDLAQEKYEFGYDLYASEPQTVNGRKVILLSRKCVRTQKEYFLVSFKDVTDIYDRLRMVLLRGAAVAAALFFIIGIVLYRGIYRILKPVNELKQTAAEIADGAYGSRVTVQGRDEIQELSVSFNRMAEKVEQHLTELSETNEKQRRLLGSLAHELKTPLTAIIGYADTLLTVRISERNRERALGYIRSEGRRLARLSEKMLELTGLYESGEHTVEQKEVRISELLARLEDLTAFRLQEKQIRFRTECLPDLTHRMDEDLMMSLLMNLVDNAYKALPERGSIRVSADQSGITVEDNGKGIPQEEVSRVTEAFYMVDKSRARSAGSVGLGLALCSQIAALHGAVLKIESRVGEGTRVSVLWQTDREQVTERLQNAEDSE